MLIAEPRRLSDNYRPLLLSFLLLFLLSPAQAQTYNPSTCCTVSNKAYGSAQATTTDGRSWFYDATNFLMRDYNGTTEVLSYLNTTASRSGHFPIYVHSGGILQSNGVWIGGSTLVYWFKDSTGSANLVRWYTDSTGLPGGPFYAIANNLSEGNAGLIKGNLSLDLVNNTSDAQKNAAAVALTNHTIDGGLNTLLNIPNSALTHNTIGLTLNNTGATPQVTTTPAALGNSLVLSVPYANGSDSGFLRGTDWTAFHDKNDSATISNDSLYNWVNGTRTLQSVIVGTGGVNSVNGTNTSLLFSPPTGNVLGQVNPAFSFNWTGQHTFVSFAPIFSTLTTNGGIFYGNASGQLLQSGAGTSGQIFESQGSLGPVFFTPNATTVDGWLGYTPLSNALGSTQIFVGNGSNVATAVNVSQDVSLANTGAATVDGILAHTLPSLSAGVLDWTGSAWAFNSTPFATDSAYFVGRGVPSNSLGINDNYYFDRSASQIFKKTAGSWSYTMYPLGDSIISADTAFYNSPLFEGPTSWNNKPMAMDFNFGSISRNYNVGGNSGIKTGYTDDPTMNRGWNTVTNGGQIDTSKAWQLESWESNYMTNPFDSFPYFEKHLLHGFRPGSAGATYFANGVVRIESTLASQYNPVIYKYNTKAYEYWWWPQVSGGPLVTYFQITPNFFQGLHTMIIDSIARGNIIQFNSATWLAQEAAAGTTDKWIMENSGFQDTCDLQHGSGDFAFNYESGGSSIIRFRGNAGFLVIGDPVSGNNYTTWGKALFQIADPTAPTVRNIRLGQNPSNSGLYGIYANKGTPPANAYMDITNDDAQEFMNINFRAHQTTGIPDSIGNGVNINFEKLINASSTTGSLTGTYGFQQNLNPLVVVPSPVSRFATIFNSNTDSAGRYLADYVWQTENTNVGVAGVSEKMRLTNTGDLLLGTATDDPSALINVTSTAKGALVPRMNTTQQNAIVSPAKSLILFNTDSSAYVVNTGTSGSPVWLKLAYASSTTSGIYLPTATAISNVTSATCDSATWSKNGNIVTVFGAITITPSANSSVATVDMSLIFASLLNGGHACFGVGTSDVAANGTPAQISGDGTNHKALFSYTTGASASGTPATYAFSFQYQIQ